jgi:hypothetical protein
MKSNGHKTGNDPHMAYGMFKRHVQGYVCKAHTATLTYNEATLGILEQQGFDFASAS